MSLPEDENFRRIEAGLKEIADAMLCDEDSPQPTAVECLKAYADGLIAGDDGRYYRQDQHGRRERVLAVEISPAAVFELLAALNARAAQ